MWNKFLFYLKELQNINHITKLTKLNWYPIPFYTYCTVGFCHQSIHHPKRGASLETKQPVNNKQKIIIDPIHHYFTSLSCKLSTPYIGCSGCRNSGPPHCPLPARPWRWPWPCELPVGDHWCWSSCCTECWVVWMTEQLTDSCLFPPTKFIRKYLLNTNNDVDWLTSYLELNT